MFFIQAVKFLHVRKQVTTRHMLQQIVEVTIVLSEETMYYTGIATLPCVCMVPVIFLYKNHYPEVLCNVVGPCLSSAKL